MACCCRPWAPLFSRNARGNRTCRPIAGVTIGSAALFVPLRRSNHALPAMYQRHTDGCLVARHVRCKRAWLSGAPAELRAGLSRQPDGNGGVASV